MHALDNLEHQHAEAFHQHEDRHEDGATAIEYGLIAALIGVAIIGAVTAVGGALRDTFNSVDAALP